MMTTTCLICVCVWLSLEFAASAANAGAAQNCPRARALSPRRQPCKKRDLRLSRIVNSSACLIDDRLTQNWTVRRLDADPSHHPAVLVLEHMAVKQEGADDVWIAKIHAQPHARILQRPAVVVGDVDGIAQERLVHSDAGPIAELEVKLMNVEVVQLHAAVFDDP